MRCRYCTRARTRLIIPAGRIYTTADYIAAFITLNNLIP